MGGVKQDNRDRGKQCNRGVILPATQQERKGSRWLKIGPRGFSVVVTCRNHRLVNRQKRLNGCEEGGLTIASD
jgi:hypothetical protein